MRFRPCIDIHNGKVKQIVGGSIADDGDYAKENFVSQMDARDYALLYKENNAKGGHVILLNAKDSPYYQADVEQARGALAAYRGGLQIGGGIDADNSAQFIDMGASHIIVTSYVFQEGEILFERLERLVKAVGAEHIVLDLSCRRRENEYYIVTNRWQKFTNQPLNQALFKKLGTYCDEFLIHAVDVEGTKTGLDEELVDMLASYEGNRVTYAGGIATFDDLDVLKTRGQGKVDFTVGSALDLFGGTLPFREIITKYL